MALLLECIVPILLQHVKMVKITAGLERTLSSLCMYVIMVNYLIPMQTKTVNNRGFIGDEDNEKARQEKR